MDVGVFKYITKPKGLTTDMIADVMFGYFDRLGINSGFIIRTWGRPFLPSVCKDYRYMSVTLEENLNGYVNGKHSDHSKWIISRTAQDGLVCVGDLNY
jgi:Deoxyribonuclease II